MVLKSMSTLSFGNHLSSHPKQDSTFQRIRKPLSGFALTGEKRNFKFLIFICSKMSAIEEVRKNFKNSLSVSDAMPESAMKLVKICSSLNSQNYVSRGLFLGKYKIFLMKNMLPWKIQSMQAQNPLQTISDRFETVFVIFGAKPKKRATTSSASSDGSHFSTSESLISPVFQPPPLQLNNPLRAKSKKYFLHALSHNEIQKLFHLCVLLGRKNRLLYPVVIFGKDHPETVFIKGYYRTEDGKQLRFHVTNPGTILELYNAPKYRDEVARHRSGFPEKIPVLSNVFAHFHIPAVQKEMEKPPSKHMNVDVECYWNSAEKLLEPPSVYATFFVNMHCVDGDDETGAYSRFKELKMITALNESLVSGEMQWPCNPKGFVMMQLEAFIDDQKKALTQKQMIPPSVTTYTFFGTAALCDRMNLDFVEKLWLILIDCSSSEELIEALTYVYTKLKEFLEPPLVNGKNLSRLSLDIISMRKKPFEVPVLDFKTAVEMLLEIGTEKLRRDYVTLFCSFELASGASLSYYQQAPLTSSKSLLFLRMLHEVLELSYICYKVFEFPKLQLSNFVRTCLEFYTSVDNIDLQHIFRFELPAQVAFYMLKELFPTTWEVSLVSSDAKLKKQTVLRFSKIPFPKHLSKDGKIAFSRSYKNSAYAFQRSTLIEDDLV